MTAELGRATTEFTYYFRSVVAALGDRPGWYGVFAGREPGAAQAYETGTDLPPWDVVRAVLHDLAAGRGTTPDEAETARARTLHQAAIAAWDAAPGADRALRARLEATVRARDLAVLRERDAARAVEQFGPAAPSSARLANVLAWARDDRERAAARCEELRARLAAIAPGHGAVPGWFRPEPDGSGPDPAGPGPRPAPAGWAERAPSWGAAPTPARGQEQPTAPSAPQEPAAGPPREARTPFWGSGRGTAAAAPQQPPAPAKRGRGRTPGGARFAGAYQEPADTAEPPAAPAPSPAPAAGATPRGARFAGAPEAPQAPRPEPRRPPDDPRWTAEARTEAARLVELRRAGRTGAAYVAICEAAEGPADRLPYLVRELEASGLAADVATLLWEVAALPPSPLASAASALAVAGREDDCRTLLRQAAARPPADIAMVAAVLTATDRRSEADELLETVARSRPAEDAADVVRARPTLAAALVDAAERVSRSRQRDVVAALRRAGLPER